MKDRIVLQGLAFHSHVGVYPEEKRRGQRFLIDAELLFEQPLKATVSDRLEDSVSYADVYELVRQLVSAARHDLIERLAGEIAEQVLVAFPSVDRIRVGVKKPQAPIEGEFDYMGVVIERGRPGSDQLAWKTADIGFGGNLGDRRETLRAGLERLLLEPTIRLVASSSLYETAAWGKTDQPDFLNAVVRVETSLDPFSLLDRLQRIEKALGRERREHWGPRTLDLDLLTYEATTIQSPRLTLPHPRMGERAFVTVPLAELEGCLPALPEGIRLYAKDWCCRPAALPLE